MGNWKLLDNVENLPGTSTNHPRKLIHQKENDTQSINESSSCLSATSMQVLGGFIFVLGIAAVAVAFTLLTTTTLGLGFVAGFGAIACVKGLGLFVAGTAQKCCSDPSEEAAMPTIR